MTRCREIQRLLARSLKRERSLAESFEVEAHVADCDACRSHYEQSEALREAFLNLPLPPVERLDLERSLASIHAELGVARGARADAPPWRRRIGAALAVGAAAAAVLVATVWLVWGSGPGRDERAQTRALAGGAVEERAPAVPVIDSPVTDSMRPTLSAVDSWMPRHSADPSTTPAAAAPSDFDRGRLLAARARVREALAAVHLEPLASTEEVGELACDVDRRLRDLVASDWPVVRMVEGFVHDSQPGVARAALRYVGFRGLRASMPALRAELDDLDRGAEAVLALADAGAEGLDGLAEAVWLEPVRPLVLTCLGRADWRGAQRYEWVEGALGRKPRRKVQQADEVVRAILGIIALEGERGAEALVARARRRDVSGGLLLDVLAQTRGAREAVMKEMLGGENGADEPFLLDCAARLRMTEALDWVTALAERGPFQRRALQVLAELPGVAAFEALVKLHRVHRPEERAFAASWGRALSLDAERARVLAAGADAWPTQGARHYLELLVLSELPEAVPAIAALVDVSALPDDDREWAMHSLLELARVEHAGELRALFARLGPDDARLAALCLIALRAIGDTDVERDLLADLSPSRRAHLLSLLDTRNPRRVSAIALLRIGRELKPLLDWNPTESWRRTQ